MRLVLTLSLTTSLLLAACTPGTPEEELKEVIQQIPWMLQVLQDCEAYKKAKMDGDKADLSTNAFNMIRGQKVSGARGEIEEIIPKPAEKPTSYALQLTMGKGVRFASQSKKRPIEAGTPVFDAVAELEKGQCVIFSGDDLEPLASSQMGKVCTPRYYIKFSEVKPCP